MDEFPLEDSLKYNIDTCADLEVCQEDINVSSEFPPDTAEAYECEFLSMAEAPVPSEAEEIPLALLPPEHPLLKRFQESLKAYLLRTKALLMSEIDDVKYNIKQKEHQREELGATLFDMQQEIRRQNEQLEDFTQQIQENVTHRHQEEEKVCQLKSEFEEKAELTKVQKTLYNKRIVELEHVQELENNIRKWSNDTENELKNAKRVVSRDAQLQKLLSIEKSKSDLLFYHLDMEVKKSEQELKMVQNEINDMEQINDVLKMSVTAANADLEVLENEHKNLSQAWSEVIVAISLRDRLLNDVIFSSNQAKESIKLHSAGIQAIRKQIKREEILYEKLDTFKTRLIDDLVVLRRDCKQQSDALTELQSKLKEIPDIMDKTEQDLSEAKREGTQIESKMRRLQIVVDKWNSKKYELEESILKLAQDQLITDKASVYRMKLIHNVKDARRNMELSLAQSQSLLAATLLDIERYKGNNFRQNQENEELKKKLYTLELQADEVNNELKQMEVQIDIKMTRMDRLMKQYDDLQHKNGNYDDSPINIKIQQMEKSIQTVEQQTRESQEFWIMLQNHFVNLTQKRNNQLNQIQVTRKQLSIIKQKSLKVDQDLEQAENISRELSRDIHIQLTKLGLLNAKMFKRRQQHEIEENDCQHEHDDLLEKLKVNELNVLRLEEIINELQIDIEHHKDMVLDKHRECLSWETKYKLIEETLRWRKAESTLNSELGSMRIEIHRMQIRYQQLKRAQEKLLQDFDRCVMHREQIFAVVTTKRNIESQPHKMKHQTTEYKTAALRSKLNQIQAELHLLSGKQLIDSKRHYEQIYEDIQRLHSEIEKQTSEGKKILGETEEGILQKHHNLDNIVRKQNRAKAYRRLIQSIQPFKLTRTEGTIQEQLRKQIEINDILVDIVQTLNVEYPQKKSYFAKILQILRD